MTTATLTRADRWTRIAVVANLVGQVVIVLTGGIVRLTGSGLGCSTWPQCEPGEFTPVHHDAITFHPYIEFGNRTLTGVLGLIAVAVAIGIWRAPATRGRSTAFRVLGLVPLAGVAAQAVIGGITVLVDLHPAVVGFHFLSSMALIWGSAALYVRLREGDGAPRPVVTGPAVPLLGRVVGVLAGVVVVLGVLVTGSGPHSGDEEVGYRFAFDPTLVSRIHAGAVWAFIAALVALLVLLARARPADGVTPADLARARRSGLVLLAVTLAQGLIGYVQYFTGLPEVLVALHLVGAALLVTATTTAILALRVRPSLTEPATPAPAAVTGVTS
ncbi:cytochrome oxidase assembly [Beutenbergia cavernae DSM 12333]|uniref:Cytochrome oxidase assembly n=1 Tax=Beutenbergia cavernae (strain ATCC BAA-8 / DSM 12333 / CCUG 43141 / JCM 11478 / NBRC 16432 / NCIMB 13614 / HKI 0122) TaxID=471853 RepID=C5BVZ6_BEUC1|nr:COX15/CtaA family protein [Beutenbergia cavernae]ACQ80597.1 cytochrome oxidase assembly [Beutenbergia cavernae DSM 12333]